MGKGGVMKGWKGGGLKRKWRGEKFCYTDPPPPCVHYCTVFISFFCGSTECTVIFAWPIYCFLKPSATKGLIFLESGEREEWGPGGKRGRGGEERQSIIQTVSYENKILLLFVFFCIKSI